MKSLLIPAAIAIGGLFVVSHLERTYSVNGVCASMSKTDHAKHHRHLLKNDVSSTYREVPANAIQVVNFVPLTEIVAASFLIDFNDAQTQLADQEIINQMEENMVQISIPDVKLADAEMIGSFTAK